MRYALVGPSRSVPSGSRRLLVVERVVEYLHTAHSHYHGSKPYVFTFEYFDSDVRYEVRFCLIHLLFSATHAHLQTAHADAAPQKSERHLEESTDCSAATNGKLIHRTDVCYGGYVGID